jgi:unsaturated rhamnogalacturonyl hydrolase
LNIKNIKYYRRENAMNKLYLFVFILIIFNSVPAQELSIREPISYATQIADSIVANVTFQLIDKESGKIYDSPVDADTKAKLSLTSPYNDWRYWNGILNIAMLRLATATDNPVYKAFAKKNVAFGFDNVAYFKNQHTNENKWSFPLGQHFIIEELDDCGSMGASVIEVYPLNQKKKYLKYINASADHILNKQTRLDDGTFVRSFPYKWTLWADDLYMGLTFLNRMGKLSGENGKKYFDDAAGQVINFHKYLFDENMGIMHHCWYSDLNHKGIALWGRANGWAILAQIDLLDYLPENHPQHDTLLTLFQKHILGIARYQGAEGLWHQLLNKPDSYEETSCSAMFTYAFARAVNKGYLDPRYKSIAERGWEGILTKIHSDGQIEGVCTGTVVSEDLVHYYKRPAPLNDIHGIGFVILAGIEVSNLKNKTK